MLFINPPRLFLTGCSEVYNPATLHNAERMKIRRVSRLIIPPHVGRCLRVRLLLHHFPAYEYKMRQVQYAANHSCWRLHIPVSFRHVAPTLVRVQWQVSPPAGISTGPSAISSLDISRTLLDNYRYFSEFQVVRKMDDPFPSVRKLS